MATHWAHLPPLWVGLGAGGGTVVHVLVCVTLNLSLHIAGRHPPPPDLWDLCLGGLSLGGSVKVGVCLCVEREEPHFSELLRQLLHWIWEKHKPPSPNYLTEVSLPRSLPPRPTSHLPADARLWSPLFTLSLS